MIVAGSGSTGFGEHADELPVAYSELGVTAVAIGLGNAFLGGISEGCTGSVPVFLHAVEKGLEGLVEVVLNHTSISGNPARMIFTQS